jgi:hypothetical protein
MSEVKNFQRNLNADRDAQSHFVGAEGPDPEESSTDEEDERIKIVAPRRKKKSPLDAMLLEQSISLQRDCLKSQKTIYKLRSEIDTEEVKSRYLKLDLNNLQVRLDEELAKTKILYRTQVENCILRTFVMTYFVWRCYVMVNSLI